MASYVYDFRHSCEEKDLNQIKSWCRKWSKKWVFQKEQGDTGYVHWQGRISLCKKREKHALKKILDFCPMYLEPSVSSSHGDIFYVTKEDTRIEGPWTDKDEEFFMPDQYAPYDGKLLPWQQYIWDLLDVFEPRKVHLIYDPTGCNGKTVLASLAEIHGRGIDLPPINDFKEIMQVMMDECKDKTRRPGSVFIDMPRSMDQSRLFGIFSGIEQIKKGKLYDTRYSYRKWWIHAPQIFVFTNDPPHLDYLSKDRWCCYIIKDKQLHEYPN